MSPNTALSHDLPPGIPEWLAQTGGGTVTRLDRHIARREAWLVDVTRADGSVLEGFFRVDRAPRADDPWSLKKETGIVRALGKTSIPVPKVYGSSDALACVLFERVPGRADLQNVESKQQQRAVMEHFMDIAADMHTLELEGLDLPAMPKPATAYDCALGEMDLVLRHWSDFVATHHDPLMTYGIDWLRRFAPKKVERISLVQGDTGPVNFMFEGDRVTSVIDWEWGHLGDPMEDLGNICTREFWNPCGGMTGLLARYEKRSGIPVNLDSVRYYRVQQQMRGMVPIAYSTIHAKPHEPIAWGLAYRYVGDRATCQAIAEAMGITLQIPDYPTDDGRHDPLAEAASWALRNDIAPATTTAFAKSRTNDVDVLVRCMERVARFGPQIERLDYDELAALLGKKPASLAAGLDALDAAIKAHSLKDEPLLQFLARRAFRAEWLYLPCTTLYPNRHWAQL